MISNYRFLFASAALRPATNPWCCLASTPSLETDDNSNNSAFLYTIADGLPNEIQNERMTEKENKYEVEVVENDRNSSSFLDLTIPSDWMEYIQLFENRKDEDGGGGAYDCLRCDYIIMHNRMNPNDSTNNNEKGEISCVPIGNIDNNHDDTEWRIWGKDFHLNRLKNSYISLFESSPEHSTHLTEESIQIALDESNHMINSLLKEAKKSALFRNWKTEMDLVRKGDNVESFIVALEKVTLLWSPPITGAKNKIIVRGHACSSGQLVTVTDGFFKPIICSIAARVHIDRHRHVQNDDRDAKDDPETSKIISSITYDGSIPTRFENPQRKIAAWTKLRKQMESPNTYKPSYAGEVLLVRPRLSDDELEILEGVSSNFFVFYNDGTLRTASDGVLYGYVRHIVLEAAQVCNIRVETNKPILLCDGENGLWKEAFITSSSRLIMPISKIFICSNEKLPDDTSFLQFWQDPVLNSAPSSTTPYDDFIACKRKPEQIWQILLSEILRRNGQYFE